MQRLLHFLSYHNAVPIALSILLLSAGAAFAASEEVQQAVYNSEEHTVAVDNTFLVNLDLNSYSPRAEITAVTEDAESYYVSYVLSTIDVVDGVWRDVNLSQEMGVAKAVLGDSVDLGVYVTAQLNELIGRQIEYLREVQAIERNAVSQKVVTTTYSGLVGKFLDSRTETLPGYTPVVVVEAEAPVGQVAGVSTAVSSSRPAAAGAAPSVSSDAGAPQLQVLGNNPARIPLKSAYADLGVYATHSSGIEFGIKTFVNDREVASVIIDTTVVGTSTVRYESTDADGRTGRAERLVVVFDPYAPAAPAEESEPVVQSTSTAMVSEGGVLATTTSNTTPAPETTITQEGVQAPPAETTAQPPPTASINNASSTAEAQ